LIACWLPLLLLLLLSAAVMTLSLLPVLSLLFRDRQLMVALYKDSDTVEVDVPEHFALFMVPFYLAGAGMSAVIIKVTHDCRALHPGLPLTSAHGIWPR